MRSLDSSLTQKEESFHECDKEKQKVLQRNDELQKTIDAKTEELLTLATKNDESDAVIHQLQTEIESLKTVEDQVSAQKGEIEALKMREEECRNIEAQVAQLQGELNTMKMSAQEFHSNLQLENNHQNQLPEGELQDVNPAAVSIRQPALNGTNATSGGCNTIHIFTVFENHIKSLIFSCLFTICQLIFSCLFTFPAACLQLVSCLFTLSAVCLLFDS